MNLRTIYEQFRADLLAQSAVSSIFGTRVYFGVIPKAAQLPAIALTPSASANDVPYFGSGGLSTATVQVSMFSPSALQVLDAYDAIVRRYNGYSGLLNSNSSALVSKVEVDDMFTYPDSNNSDIINTVFDVVITYNGA